MLVLAIPSHFRPHITLSCLQSTSCPTECLSSGIVSGPCLFALIFSGHLYSWMAIAKPKAKMGFYECKTTGVCIIKEPHHWHCIDRNWEWERNADVFKMARGIGNCWIVPCFLNGAGKLWSERIWIMNFDGIKNRIFIVRICDGPIVCIQRESIRHF